jgi:adenylate kinase
MKVIIIFGAPGSGKGTQAKLLCKKLNFIHFSTGEELRKEVAKKTKLGNQINKIISKGNLVSDEISTSITKRFILKNKNKNILLDGFPRNLIQAENCLNLFKKLKISSIQVINLKVRNKYLIKRILDRAKIENRADDNKKTIKKRLKVYSSQTKPILKFLKNNKIKILTFNGNKEIEQIQKEIIGKIKNSKI